MVDSELAFNIVARDLGASAAFERVARAADKSGDSMSKTIKVSEATAKASEKLTAARNKEDDALGRVSQAEARLSEVRSSTTAKTSQIIAAENALTKARRTAAMAGNDAAKASKDLAKTLEDEAKRLEAAGKNWAKKLGSGFASVAKNSGTWLTGVGSGGFKAIGQQAASGFGNGFLAGIGGVMKTPLLGPVVVGALTAVVTTASTAVGAVAAGAIVAGFGAGITGLGALFAAKSTVVKAEWKKTWSDLGTQTRLISKPFESTLAAMAIVAQRTFNQLRPALTAAFKTLAPAVTAFGDSLGSAFAKLAPAIQPLANAFRAVLGALGPGLNDMFRQISASLVQLSDSVSKNPTALADFARGLGGLTSDLVSFLAHMNDADAAFKRFAGISAVTAVMDTLRGAVMLTTGVLDGLAQGFDTAGQAGRWFLYHFIQNHPFAGPQHDASTAAAATTTFSSSLFKAANALTVSTTAGLNNAHATHEANVQAAIAADTLNRQTNATNALIQSTYRLQNLALGLFGSQINYATAVDTATKALKTNGETHSFATAKGRSNLQNLHDLADAANNMTTQMLQNNSGVAAAAGTAERAKTKFYNLAVQMGYGKAEAKALADKLIAIPKDTQAKVSAPGAVVAKGQVDNLQKSIDLLHGKTVQITYTSSGVNLTTPSMVGGSHQLITPKHKASGGRITGPGTATSDSIPAMLSTGEHVWSAREVQGAGGHGAMEAMRASARVAGFASGGAVAAVNVHSQGVFASVAKAKAQLQQMLFGSVGVSGGSGGAARWQGVALQALALAGEPSTWIGSLLRRMNQESGGNPRAINLWDSNAKAGTPSIGLMQTIGPTFNAYAGALASRGIYDPLANIYAAIRYTVARYGSGPAGWDRPGGYAKGTPWVPNDQMAYLHKGEAVVPAAVNRQARSSGASVAAGLAQGVRGGAGSPISAAGQIAMGMIAKAKQVLGIASPSKAFALLGLYVNQGFAQGLQGSAKTVQSVMTSLIGKVINISFNSASTRTAIQKQITSLNASLQAAEQRIRPVTGTRSQRASIERSNSATEARIATLRRQLKAATTDLASLNSIASKVDTAKERNRIIAYLNTENKAMQVLANKRAAIATQLKAAQSKLAAAITVRDDFKKSITDAALSFNSITNVQAPADGPLTASQIIAQMTETLRKTQQFAANLAQLKRRGLNSTTYEQIASAGVDQGGTLATALLSGNANTFNTMNRLQANISSASAGLGNTAAKNLYQAGVDAAQGLVNGLLAKTKALDAASKKLALAIVASIKKQLGIRSPSKVLEWHGAMVGQGFANGIIGQYGTVQKAAHGMGGAALPDVRNWRGGSTGGDVYNVTFNIDGSKDPSATADEVLKALLKLKRNRGNLPLGLG